MRQARGIEHGVGFGGHGVGCHALEQRVGDRGGVGVGVEGEGPCGRVPGPGLMGRTAWTLRVQTGCDEACRPCLPSFPMLWSSKM